MQNGTITYYLPYNILSSSNLVVIICIVEYKFNPRWIQWGAQGARAPPPPSLNFQSGNFLTIIFIYNYSTSVLHTWMYTPSYLKGCCLGCIIGAIDRLKTQIRQWPGQVLATSPLCGDRSKIFRMQIFKIDHSEHLKIGICCDWSSFFCPPLTSVR